MNKGNSTEKILACPWCKNGNLRSVSEGVNSNGTKWRNYRCTNNTAGCRYSWFVRFTDEESIERQLKQVVRKTNFLDSTAAHFYFCEYNIFGTWKCVKSEALGPKIVEVGDSVTFRSDGMFVSTSEHLGFMGTYSYKGTRISTISRDSINNSFLLKTNIYENEMQWTGIDSNENSFDYCFRRE